MPSKKIQSKLISSTSKIANIADLLLNEDGHENWEIDEIHLKPKNNNDDRIICKYIKVGEDYEMECRNASDWSRD